MPRPGQNPSGHDLITAGPVTFVDRVRPDGVIVRLESRFHRKHQKPAPVDVMGATGHAHGLTVNHLAQNGRTEEDIRCG